MIRSSVPKLDLDDIFEQKNDIAETVKEELEKVIKFFFNKMFTTLLKCILLHITSCPLNKTYLYACVTQAMAAYGYEIVQTLIVDIAPDERVKRAMNEINAGKLTSFLSLDCVT